MNDTIDIKPAKGMGKIPLNMAVGDRVLCAWQPVNGMVWAQTRNADYAELMAKRLDGRVVVRGVAGGYLRIFEFERPLSWAIELMARYTAGETPANEAIIDRAAP